MKNQNKKFVCLFDPSHILAQEKKLILHMKKCPAPQKKSYECCKYNQLHWVKYETIQKHQSNCPDRNKVVADSNSNILPTEISKIHLEIPFQVQLSMIGGLGYNQPIKNSIHQFTNIGVEKQKNIKKKIEKKGASTVKKLWEEPDFEKFLLSKGYRDKNNENQNIKRGQNLFQDESCLF